MKYYIATLLQNMEQHNTVRDWLNTQGHEITYDWTTHGPVFSQGLERCKEVAVLEEQGVVEADVVIVLWPGGRGTHIEMGMAISLGVPVVMLTTVEEHYQCCPETCAFYHHPCVELVKSMDELECYINDFES